MREGNSPILVLQLRWGGMGVNIPLPPGLRLVKEGIGLIGRC